MVKEKYGKHYSFTYKGVKIDPYRILKIYGITDPAHQHAIKKLLRAGQSVKSLEQDIEETIVTLQRWKEMLREDVGVHTPVNAIPVTTSSTCKESVK